jgi:hypothetical protein
MNTPEDHQNEPPILPGRNIPADWQRQVTDFLGGNMSMNRKGALREKINGNPEFMTYVSGLAATEARLAALLAESRYQEAEPKEPPAWALERLRGAVVQVNRSGAPREGALARFLAWIQELTGIGGKGSSKALHESPDDFGDILGAALPRKRFSRPAKMEAQPPLPIENDLTARKPESKSWLTVPRFVLAGSAFAIAAVLVIVLPKLGKQSSELVADSAEIKRLLNLSPETFIASVGSPNVVRSAGRYIYSPSGVTSQIDPIVLLSPDLNPQNIKIEVSVPGNPEWIPIQGDFSGVPQPLSKILQKSPGLQAGEVYQIRLIARGEIVSEETFRMSDQLDLQVPESPSALLQASLGAVNDVPPRPGDALGLLAQLPEKYQNDQAVIRVRYKALTQIGAFSEANNCRNRIR